MNTAQFSPKIIASLAFAVILLGGTGMYAFINRVQTDDAQPVPLNNITEQTNKDNSSTDDITGGNDTTLTNNEADTTRTQSIADQIFGTYFARKDQNAYSKEDGDKIVNIAAARAMEHNIVQYKEKDILTTNSTSKDSIIAYKTAVKDALAPVFSIPEYELQTYARASEKNDPKEFTKLKEESRAYETAVENLMKIKVPEDAVMPHLLLVNSFLKVSYALSEMSKGYDDVVASFSALKVFGEGEKEVQMAFQSHKTYFVIHNVDDL